MKSQHRHELKTNELAEWMANFPDWLKQNRRMIIYVSVLIIVVMLYYFWFRYRSSTVAINEKAAFTALIDQIPRTKALVVRASASNTDNAFLMLDLAKKLRNMADQTKNNELAALALIKSAELIRGELLYRIEPPRQDEVAKQIALAKEAYDQVIQRAASDASLLAKAKFGLGLCEEELGNFQQAREIYEQVAEDPAFKGTVAVAQAQTRLDTMSDYRSKVAFAPAPVVAPTQPEIQLDLGAQPTAPVAPLFPETAAEQPAPATPDTNAATN